MESRDVNEDWSGLALSVGGRSASENLTCNSSLCLLGKWLDTRVETWRVGAKRVSVCEGEVGVIFVDWGESHRVTESGFHSILQFHFPFVAAKPFLVCVSLYRKLKVEVEIGTGTRLGYWRSRQVAQ